MSKPTTIKEALKKLEDKHSGLSLSTSKEIHLQFQYPPIEKMDNSLSILIEILSLSTNMIEKISGLNSLKNLKVLSLARNNIKSISGLEGVSDTLQQLWISYNFIEKLKGIGILKQLRVLYISHNLIKEWSEFNKLQELPNLEDLQFVGNPLHESVELEVYRSEVLKRLPKLSKLDGETIIHEEETD